MVTFPANYYNRFDAAKKYKKLLFRAARGLQSAEMNEIADTIQYEFRSVIETLFQDGSLLKGGKIVSLATPGDYAIQPCLFYARGYAHDLPVWNFSIGTLESCIIGVAIKETVVGEDDDPELRDPAINTRNFNEPGAHRLKVTARWTKAPADSDEYFYAVYEFKDGVLIVDPGPAPEIDGFMDIIARYDRDAHGSYVVHGCYVTYLADDNTTNEHIFNVSDGLAHVDGYEQYLYAARRIRIPFAMDTRVVTNEPFTFTGTGNYTLRWGPIANVTEVNGITEVVATITHGAFSGSSDLLPNTPVSSIVAVNQGGTWTGSAFTGGTTYTNGTDYVQNGDHIDWSPAGAEPSPGSTYTCVFRYSRVVTVTISGDRTQINVAGFANGTTFFVDYTHYLPRYDVIGINRNNVLFSVQGISDWLDPKPPQPNAGLILATVLVNFGKIPVITSQYVRARHFDELQQMASDIDDLKYNISRLSLLDILKSTDPTSTKIGTFVDPITDDTYRDAGISQNAQTASDGLHMQILWSTTVLRSGAPITLPFTETTFINQDAVTKTRLINPNAVVLPPPATVILNPPTYRWVASSTNTWAWAGFGWDHGPMGLVNQSIIDNTINGPVTMPQITIQVTSVKFNAGETVNIFFDGVLIDSAVADSGGTVVKTITTPAWAQSGAREVRVLGLTSGVAGAAIFNSSAVNRVITNWFILMDPLAQTYTPDADVFVTSVDVSFGVKPVTLPVDVLLTETTTGLPDRTKIAATKRLQPADITASTVNFYWTRATFTTPISSLAGKEFAFILATTDVNASVRCAEVGQYDIVKNRWVSSNAYGPGVLLESSNLSTWLPFNKEDLTFRLQKAVFSLTSTVNLGSITGVTSITDLLILAKYEAPPGTTVRFYATLLTGGRAGEVVVLEPGVPKPIVEYTGDFSVKMDLTSNNANVTPTVSGDISIATGVLQSPSTYVTRAILIQSTAIKIKTFIEIYEPLSNQITVEYRNAADTAWVVMTRGSGTQIGDGWVSMPWSATISAGAIASTRFRVTMSTTDKYQRPAARKFQMYLAASTVGT